MNNLWVKFGDANGVKWPLVPNLARLFLSPNPPVPPPSKPHTDNTAAPEGSFADGQCGRITDFDLGAVSLGKGLQILQREGAPAWPAYLSFVLLSSLPTWQPDSHVQLPNAVCVKQSTIKHQILLFSHFFFGEWCYYSLLFPGSEAQIISTQLVNTVLSEEPDRCFSLLLIVNRLDRCLPL